MYKIIFRKKSMIVKKNVNKLKTVLNVCGHVIIKWTVDLKTIGWTKNKNVFKDMYDFFNNT